MESEALARFAEAIGTAFHSLAADLRVEERKGRTSESPALIRSATGLQGLRLGVRERQVVSLFARLGAGRDLAAREIADGIGGYDKANIYFPIRTLVNKGLLEEVSGARPRKWRATERLLAAFSPVAREDVSAVMAHARVGIPADGPDAAPRLLSPQEFYAEATKRPDVSEILRRLAK